MKKMKVGADPFPPYQFKNPDGTISGTDYERVVKILRAAGYEPEVVIDDWSVVYGEMEDGILDALFQVQDTPERLEKYFFSDLLRYAVTQIIASDKKNTMLKQYSDIPKQGLRLGVLTGFVNGEDIDALPNDCKQCYPDMESLLQAIRCGEVDLAVCDQGVSSYLAKKMEIENLYIVEALTYKRPLYVMFQSEADRDVFNKWMKIESEADL